MTPTLTSEITTSSALIASNRLDIQVLALPCAVGRMNPETVSVTSRSFGWLTLTTRIFKSWTGSSLGALSSFASRSTSCRISHDTAISTGISRISALGRRQDPLAPDLGLRLGRHVLDELLQLGGGHRGRGRGEEALGELVDPRRRGVELGGDRGAPSDQLALLRQHLLARRHQLGGLAIVLEDRLDHQRPTAEQDADPDRERHERALSAREVPDHLGARPGSPPRVGSSSIGSALPALDRPGRALGAGLVTAGGGGANAAGGGGAAATASVPGDSHEARILNCSRSRPR